MLVTATRLIGTPILSMQAGGAITQIADIIVDPDNLRIIAFRLGGGVVSRSDTNILDVSSIREYSKYGIVIDSIDELVAPDDVIKISNILKLNFSLNGLKVKTRKGSKLGKVINYTVNSDDFIVQQIIVQRPIAKRLMDPELTISRKEIVEVTDYEIVIKDEEKKLKEKAEKEEFVPNFVNPFRSQEPGFAPADTEIPADKDIE